MYTKIMKIASILLITFVFSSLSGQTIVPNADQITDFEAKLALAKIFSEHSETQKAALQLYEEILKDPTYSIPLLDHPKISNIQKTDSETIVPKADWITHFDATFALAKIFTRQKKNQEALKLYEDLIQEKPDNIELVIDLGRLYIKMKRSQEGLDLLYTALQMHPGNLPLLVATAQAQTSLGHAKEANALFLRALDLSDANDSTWVDYADSMMMWGDFYKAEAIFRCTLGDLSIKLAGSLEAQARYEEAEDIYRELLLARPDDPKVLERLIKLKIQEKEFDQAERLAESLQDRVIEQEDEDEDEESLLCQETTQDLYKLANDYLQNGDSETALSIFSSIVEIDPEYFPGQIGKAETLSIHFCYASALEIYQELLESFPENAKLLLAIARVYSWSKDYETALDYYDALIQLNPENPVPYREKARTALWDKRFALAMKTYDLLLNMPNPLIQESAFLEKRAKTLNWNKRYLCAIPAYEELIDFNPGNEEALFDYAQVYCSIGMCCESKEIYEHILELDPNHTIAQMALYRNEARNNIGLQTNFSYWREIGSGTFSASQIARYRLDEVIEVPLSCSAHVRFIQQEYVENPFYNFKFYPAIGQTFEADCLFNEHVSGFVSATYKSYFGKFNSTFTTHNRLLFTINDYLQVLLSYNKEDEIYNYFSLKEGIQSNIGLITLSSNLTRYWNASATCQYYNYNDHNSQIHYNLLTEYQLTDGQDVLKVILQGDYRNAAHQTIIESVGTKISCMTHPYWTPDHYFSGALTFEWRHDYRQFEFCEAPQAYLDVKVTGLLDNAKNPSVAGIVEWKHEFECHFGFEIKGFIQRGPLWNAEGAWGTLSYRF